MHARFSRGGVFLPQGHLPVAGLILAENSTTLKFIQCDFIESGSFQRVLMIQERGCGLARYGDGLQRSLRSFVLADDEQWVS